MSMDGEEDVSVGLWAEFLNLLLDAGARSEASPYGVRSTADVAVDPHRIAVSDELRSGKSFLRFTKKELRDRIERLQKVISDYDDAQDA